MRLPLPWLATLLCALTLTTPRLIAQSIPQPIIIDTDIGDDIDDAFALALAVRTPQLHILGITTTFGDTALRAHLTMRLLEAAHSERIPVFAGEPTPHKTVFPEAPYAQADTHPIARKKAIDFILEQGRRSPGRVTLIAIGPLMNIGAAIDRDPASFRKLKRVILMSGSIHQGYRARTSPFALSPKPTLEWNTQNDPASARKLLASGVPVFLMPLDSTQIALPPTLESQINAQSDPLSQSLTELVLETKLRVILYDVVTVAYAIDPSICPAEPMHIDVDDKGYTRPSSGTPNASVCLVANEANFLQLLTKALVIAAHK